ncbi:MAG: diguanylate cyclase [Roseburia sp.]|jgi:diguanylate cyclase (GGDEF)-like protein|nr:diguanylate cyclase [Roseburia sp.]
MEKILIVDDSPLQGTQLKSILNEEYDVTVAQTAEDGFALAISGDYSLILLDVVMPGMDGFTMLKKLQEEVVTKHVPVILITSLSDAENESHGLMLGAVDYITKPFHPVIVHARVRTHIRLYEYRKQLELLSMTDQLTGLANRRRYERYSRIKWQEAIRLQVPFSICMFDIDHFKAYNDSFGHPAGDKVIAAVANALSTRLRRSTDFVARYGGEEFVAIVLGGDASAVFGLVKKIRQEIENLHIPHTPAVSEWVTVSSGGVTIVPKTDTDYSSYLKVADAMLYDAKRFGRNQVVWYGDDQKQWVEE